MATIPDVSQEVWRGLYKALTQFGELQPWELFSDSDLFGVQDPITSEMGYACILGAMGEMFALCLYRGAEGFSVHRRMQRGEITPETDDAFALQNCLMAEFTDKKYLEKPDKAVIQELGLRFRGPKSWPLFRSHRPGYLPWFLTQDEAAFLTFALQCACDFTRKAKTGELESKADERQIFSYVPAGREKDSSNHFRTGWEPFPIYQPKPLSPLAIDAARINAIQSKSFVKDGAWEADIFFIPSPVMEQDRPYFTRCALLAQKSSGIILNMQLHPPDHPPHQGLADAFLECIEKHRLLPEEVHLRDETMVFCLSSLTKSLGIRFDAKNRLSVIPFVRREMEKGMMQGRI